MLLHASGLACAWPTGEEGVRAVLEALGCIQLDPIDRIGTNADLVAAARVDGLRRGDVHRALRGRSFEHFAKERCVLHARYFPHYRGRAVQVRWWRHSERMKRLPESLVADVLAEVTARGPCTPHDLEDRGRVDPIDWNGWSSTAKAATLALEVLWTRCDLVVSGRDERGRRLYDLPARALGAWADAPAEGVFHEVLLLARVRAAGLLARHNAALWALLDDARKDGTIDRFVATGRLVEVQVGRRTFLTLPELLDVPEPVERPARVLGPLDPLLWDRALVEQAFGFKYTWDVYKKAENRQHGWYVVPVLAGGRLVGRLEAARDAGRVNLLGAWDVPRDVLAEAMAQLEALNAAIDRKKHFPTTAETGPSTVAIAKSPTRGA